MKTAWYPLLQRLRYWQGQALRSRDLNDQMAFEDLVRIWHTRALHQAYGVREGLEVGLALTEPAVIVSPGLAFDARGRELIVGGQRQLPLPEIPASGLILALSYRESGASCSRDLSTVCWPDNAPVDRATHFSWLLPERFDPRQAVALARLMPGPVLAPAFSAPRARPLAKPRIGHGSTIPGNTAWRLWEREIENSFFGEGQGSRQVQVLGLEVDVDTAATGFTAAPCYQAWVEGDLWNPDLIDLIGQRFENAQFSVNTPLLRLGAGLALLQLLELRFGHVHQPTATGFTYRLWFPQISKWRLSQSLFEYLLLLAHEGELIVSWIGIQESHVETSAQALLSLSSKECQ